MSSLTAVLAALVLGAAPPGPAGSTERWDAQIGQASARCAVPAQWIVRVMRAESGGSPVLGGRPIRSPKGAMGLMQLMPKTWADMRLRLGLGNDPDDPRDNIVAGACYLRMMYDRFGYPGLFAAYNAGPARYADYLAGRTRLPGETVAYLGTVTGARREAPTKGDEPPRQLLFALRHDLDDTASGMTETPTADGLFAVRKDGP